MWVVINVVKTKRFSQLLNKCDSKRAVLGGYWCG